VYRARDSRLNRDVAIKVLPADVTADHDRLARFEREAQVLASLNHPNIAQIHGVDDSSGAPALVMELVDGPTLADRIAKGPIPLDEALPIAKQIAEALEAAHEQGIIHRDLKPANIKVRADGTVKVLDFGLAKALDSVAPVAGNATMSPTLSIHGTQAGIILGTAAYMSPEQARGKAVDRRVDIWAFGCVLYEMLTGRRAFDGDDSSITLASVLKSNPDWQRLPAATPSGLRGVLVRCLTKDPKDRLQAIGDARIDINELIGGLAEPDTLTPVKPISWWGRAITMTVVTLLAAVLAGAAGWFAAWSRVPEPRVSRLDITLPTATALSIGVSRDVALTPDGSRLVYIGASGTTLFVRALDQIEATPLARGASLRDPFVSPDGQWVGFFEGSGTMKKVALTGGPSMLVAEIDGAERGATWAADGTIIFATNTTGLRRISADGGAPTALSRPDRTRGEGGYIWPELLPGRQAVFYTVTGTTGGLDGASIAVLDLRSGRQTFVLRGGSYAQYGPSGYLVYAVSGTLRAVRFDPARLITVGPSSVVVPQVATTQAGAIEAALARDGTLVYVAGGASSEGRTLVWVDRQGRETPTGAPPRPYLSPRLSPDGTRVAVSIVGVNGNVWIWDLGRQTLQPLALEPGIHASPVWTPDGGRVVFASDRAGGLNLFRRAANGIGVIERLTQGSNPQLATAITPDGTRLVFHERSSKTGDDVMTVQLGDPHRTVPLVQTPSDERNGMVSPDGRWLAYEANDTGTFEIHVRPYPDVTSGHWLVSTNGGTQPLWAPSGRELFYVTPDGALMQVAVAGGPRWAAGAPTMVLAGRYAMRSPSGSNLRAYDIARDGQRFLMMKGAGNDATSALPQIVVVQHFDEELKRLVPMK
jgi:serine/threonine-protein kinase